MADKVKRASEYKSEQVALVRSTCLYVASCTPSSLADAAHRVAVAHGAEE